MKKSFIITSIILSAISYAELTGKVSYNLAFPIRLNTKEMDEKQTFKNNKEDKKVYKLNEQIITKDSIKDMSNNVNLDTNIKLDLGWGNAPIIYGFEVGTQEYDYTDDNMNLLKLQDTFKDFSSNKYLGNAYIGYKNDNILLNPYLKIAYYLKGKDIDKIPQNTLLINQKISDTFSGINLSEELEMKSTLKSEKNNFIATFDNLKFNIGISKTTKNNFVKGNLKFEYSRDSELNYRQPIELVIKKYYFNKPMYSAKVDNSANSQTTDNKLVGYSIKNDYFTTAYYTSTKNIDMGKNYELNNKFSTLEKEKLIKYNIAVEPIITYENKVNDDISLGIESSLKIQDIRNISTQKLNKLTEENLATYKKENTNAVDLVEKEGIIKKERFKTSYKTMINPYIKINYQNDLNIKISSKLEIENLEQGTSQSFYNFGTKRDEKDSTNNKVQSLIFKFNPILKLDYEKKLNDKVKIKHLSYLEYNLETLFDSNIKTLVADENGEYIDTKSPLEESGKNPKPIQILAFDKEGRVKVIEPANKERYVKYEELTYNEAGYRGKKLEKKSITEKLPTGIIKNEASIYSDTTFIFNITNKFNVNLGMGAKFKFSKGEIRNIMLKNIDLVPHLGLGYEF